MNPLNPTPRRAAWTGTATALAAALCIGTTPVLVQAATPTTATVAATTPANSPATTQPDAVDDALMKFSQAGQDAIDSVRLARLDLFSGKTDLATKDMKAAQMSLIQAKAEAPSFATTTQVKVEGQVVGTDKDAVKSDVVPIDGDIVLADHMKLQPQHQGALAKARGFLHMGDKASAVKTLKASQIDVAYQRRWLALPEASQQLDHAIELASQGKYYEANLALKAIEDGVQTDTVSFAAPAQSAPAAS